MNSNSGAVNSKHLSASISINGGQNNSQEEAILDHRKVEVSKVSKHGLCSNNITQNSQQHKAILNMDCVSINTTTSQKSVLDTIESDDEYYDTFDNLTSLGKAIKTQSIQEEKNSDIFFDSLETLTHVKEAQKSQLQSQIICENSLSNESADLALDQYKNIDHIVRKTQLSFEQLVDDFLSTPKEYFYPIDEALLQRKTEYYELWNQFKAITVNQNELSLVSNKVALNNFLASWIKGEITVKKFRVKLFQLEKKMQTNLLSCSFFMEQVVLLKRYRAVLYGEDIPITERLQLYEALYDLSNLVKNNQLNIFYFDLLTLHMLLMFDCLPKIKMFGNYDLVYHQLYNFRKMYSQYFFLFSQVSFTTVDLLRFDLVNYKQIKEILSFLNSTYVINRFFKILVAFEHSESSTNGELETQTDSPIPLILKELDISLLTRYSIYNAMALVMDLIEKIHSIKDLDPKSMERKKNARYILSGLKKGASTHFYLNKKIITHCTTDTTSHFTLYANALLLLSSKLDESVYLTVARLYQKASAHMPVYAYKAYYYYYKAGYLNSASAAALQYANFCKKMGVGSAEYWQDVSEKLLGLYNHSIATNKLKDESKQEEFDIDAALNFIEGDSGSKERRKKERKIKANKQTLTGELASKIETKASIKRVKKTTLHELNSVKIKHQSSDYLHLPNHEITALGTKSAKKLWLKECNRNKKISVTKEDFNTNVARLSSEFSDIKPLCLKTSKPKLAFHQKLLERFWDSKIQQTLDSIRHARIEGDIDKEKQIYSEIMSSKQNKKLVGIERIWEERAWTELHQFDDFFSSGILVSSYKTEAKCWIKIAKETYLLPALARYLNVNHFGNDVKPEEIWKLANALVESDVLQENKHDNDSVRFRLRCLFSTMGHIYSLLAMVEPTHYKKFNDIARKYFSYKNIDLVYSQSVTSNINEIE